MTSQISIDRCTEFFRHADQIVKSASVYSGIDISIIFEKAKQFFEETYKTISLISSQEKVSLDECRTLFRQAEKSIRKRQPQPPIVEFQKFCKNAYLPLIRKYRQWVKFIEENSSKGENGFPSINLFMVFGISRKEDAHSKFLVWLMKEEETHGLGDIFLTKFLDIVSNKHGSRTNISTKGVDIIPEAAGKHGTPDIKIKGDNCLCIVENKIKAMEGEDQTKRYRDDALEEITDMRIPRDNLFLIFLTPTGRTPNCDDFKIMNYREIIKLLKEILYSHETIPDETRFLIEQFVFNLQMEIFRDFELQKRIEVCLRQFSSKGDTYLWENQENIFDIYSKIIATSKEGR